MARATVERLPRSRACRRAASSDFEAPCEAGVQLEHLEGERRLAQRRVDATRVAADRHVDVLGAAHERRQLDGAGRAGDRRAARSGVRMADCATATAPLAKPMATTVSSSTPVLADARHRRHRGRRTEHEVRELHRVAPEVEQRPPPSSRSNSRCAGCTSARKPKRAFDAEDVADGLVVEQRPQGPVGREEPAPERLHRETSRAAASSAMRADSSRLMVNGFSPSTCLPASARARCRRRGGCGASPPTRRRPRRRPRDSRSSQSSEAPRARPRSGRPSPVPAIRPKQFGVGHVAQRGREAARDPPVPRIPQRIASFIGRVSHAGPPSGAVPGVVCSVGCPFVPEVVMSESQYRFVNVESFDDGTSCASC